MNIMQLLAGHSAPPPFCPQPPGIIKFRSWCDTAGAIPWPEGLRAAGLGPVLPRRLVLDRLSQHTSQCKDCRAALAVAQRGRTAALLLAATAAVAAMAVMAAAATLPGAISAAAAATAVLTPPSWLAPVLVMVALAAVAVGIALGELMRRLTFVDYVHAFR